jgi:hypothetical protein
MYEALFNRTTTRGLSVIKIPLNQCDLPVWSIDLPVLIVTHEIPGSVSRNGTNQAPRKRTTCPAPDQEVGVCTIHYGVSRNRSGSSANAFDRGGRNHVR